MNIKNAAFALVAVASMAAQGGDSITVTPEDFEAKVAAAQDGDRFSFGAGTYYLTDEIRLSGRKDVSFIGAGQNATFLEPKPDATTGERTSCRFLGIELSSDILFEGMTFRNGSNVVTCAANKTANGGVAAVNASSNIQFKACGFINNAFVGLPATGDSTSTQIGVLGGVIYAEDSWIRTDDCIMEGNLLHCNAQGNNINLGARGSALYLQRSNWKGNGLVIRRNFAVCKNGYAGFCVYMNGAVPMAFCELEDALIVENGSCADIYTKNGEIAGDNLLGDIALSVVNSSACRTTSVLRNCTIANNHAQTGLSFTQSFSTLENCVIWGHLTDVYAQLDSTWSGGLYGTTTSPSLIKVKRGAVSPLRTDPGFTSGYRIPQTSAACGQGAAGIVCADPRTWYVAPNGNDVDNDGRTESAPLETLGKAIALSSDFDTIILAAGCYSADRESFPIAIRGRRVLRIVGAGKSRTFLDAANGTFSSVFDIDGSNDIHVEGVSIVNNRAALTNLRGGGAIWVHNSWNVRFRDCAIHGNAVVNPSGIATSFAFGMVYLWRSVNVSFEGCDIAGNSADFTGSARNNVIRGFCCYSDASCATFDRCRFVDNSIGERVTAVGLALAVMGGNVAVRNSLVAGNVLANEDSTSVIRTGGVLCSGVVTLDNCTISGNADVGVQPANASGANLKIQNTIVTGNAVGDVGVPRGFGGSTAMSNASQFPTVSMSVNLLPVLERTWEDFDDPEFKSMTGSLSDLKKKVAVTGIIHDDEPGFKDAAKGDYRLTSGSPAVDKGSELDWMTGALDLAGGKRQVGYLNRKEPIPDIGCYELARERGLLLIVR